jgi:hypothetical protein
VVLDRSNLVKFASTPEMLASDNPIIQQFLAGRPEGPIGMDEMADSGQDMSRFIEGDTAALEFGPTPLTGPGTEKRRQLRVVRPGTSGVLDFLRRIQSPAASPHTVSTIRRLTT